MEQLRVGSGLLGAIGELILLHMAVSTSCWMGHPMLAGWRQGAVSWPLPCFAICDGLPGRVGDGL
eukprot:5447476-Pyramimonas_sp.AAC.1